MRRSRNERAESSAARIKELLTHFPASRGEGWNQDEVIQDGFMAAERIFEKHIKGRLGADARGARISERMAMTTPVRIVGVAIRVGDMFAAMEAPARHPMVLRRLFAIGISTSVEDQGFYTSEGRFVTREEALPIAEAAGQIVEKHGSARILFSEDMW